MGAITAEDEAFERTLQAMANEEPPEFSEGASLNVLKKDKSTSTHLKEFLDDYTPASNVNQLMEQVHLAKEFGADSIEATAQIIKYYCRKHYPDDVGYFHFHDVKVWIEGFWDTHKHVDSQTIEQKLFGQSKTKTAPVMQMDQKK